MKNFDDLDDKTIRELADQMDRAKQDDKIQDLFSQFKGMTGKQIFGADYFVDEDEFAKMQTEHPWSMQASISFANKMKRGKEEKLDFWESLSMISCYIFGTMGFEKDLDRAEEMLNSFLQINATREQVSFILAHTNILRGTIFTYRKEYVKACYYFMSGLKVGTNLSIPYCDFIRYILEKTIILPKSDADYRGVGYSEHQYCGSAICTKDKYDRWAAIQIIPCLEGDNGELILAHQGTSGLYGYLEKCGESNSIDIFETYIIDINFNLKKISFYFNSYFSSKEPKQIKIPDGYHINKDYAPNRNGEIIGCNGQYII